MAGQYDLKSPLPTEASFGERFKASRFTVRQALETLVVEGLIYRRAGSGTFITSPALQQPYLRILGSVEDAMALGDETAFFAEHPLRLENSKVAAGHLSLEREEVCVLRGTRYISQTPFGYWQIYLPTYIGDLLGDNFSGRECQSIISKVKQETGAQILHAEQAISAELAGAHIAEVLDISIDSPVLKIERLYFDHKNDPLEWSVSKYTPDQYNYRINLYSQPTRRSKIDYTLSTEETSS